MVSPPKPRPSAFTVGMLAVEAMVDEVTQRGQVLALALGHVVVQLARGSDGVGLEGKVDVSDLLVIALDGGEKLVGSGLNTLGDLHEHTLFHALQVCLSTLGNTLGS